MADKVHTGDVESEAIEIQEKTFSTEEKKVLLSIVEENRCLWDSASPDFQNKKKKHEAFNLAATSLGTSLDCIKKALHSLRTSMVREVKRSKGNSQFKSKWHLYDSMLFMKEEILRSLESEDEEKWTDEDIEMLINFYKENPLLWDISLQEYRNRDSRRMAFKKLGELLNKTEEECKKQWHSLRVQFNKNCTRHESSKKSGTGTDEVFTPSWKFFDSMLFTRESLEVDASSSTLSDSLNESEPVPKRRKNKSVKTSDTVDQAGMEKAKLDMYQAAIEVLKAPPPTSNEGILGCGKMEVFGRLVAETLSRFDGQQRAFAKKRINDVLFEIEMGGSLHGPSSLSVIQPNYSSTPNSFHQDSSQHLSRGLHTVSHSPSFSSNYVNHTNGSQVRDNW